MPKGQVFYCAISDWLEQQLNLYFLFANFNDVYLTFEITSGNYRWHLTLMLEETW
ncbi:hypothetical protein D3OALGA1CA_4919 [Olavius algarvensis associated proteobacterium Delta 3]|nr:hypothetical protein D3OALGB2SA_2204 [Olavius algarvensis associated proteobacterium Delta 3]CAB5158884.1 hypothetical protein D3OALGA1CA_4919 [Olavius algarvensis associated proteobacterium Delta 3]